MKFDFVKNASIPGNLLSCKFWKTAKQKKKFQSFFYFIYVFN